MWAYYLFEAHELADRRAKEAERARLGAEARGALAWDRGPNPVRRLGARCAATVSRLSAGLARALDERALEPRRSGDAAS